MSSEKLLAQSQALYDAGVQLDDKLEAAKLEVLRAEGASRYFSEYYKKFDAWTGEVRLSLIKEINEGKTTAEVANTVLAWLSKGREHVDAAAGSAKILHGVRQGEVSACASSVALMRELYLKSVENAKAAKEQEELAVQPTPAEEVKHTEEDVDLTELVVAPPAPPPAQEKKSKKKRPDEDPSHPLFTRIQDIRSRKLAAAGQQPEEPKKTTRGRKKKLPV